MCEIGVTVYQLLTEKYPFDTKIGRDDHNGTIMNSITAFLRNGATSKIAKISWKSSLSPPSKIDLLQKQFSYTLGLNGKRHFGQSNQK